MIPGLYPSGPRQPQSQLTGGKSSRATAQAEVSRCQTGGRRWRAFTGALLVWGLLGAAWSSSGAGPFYVAPNGSTGNNGLSTNSPWPLTFALANVGSSNTIILMDGFYTGGPFNVSGAYQTLKALNKWGPKFYNLASDGTGGAIRVLPGVRGDGTVVDGLSFSNCQYYPILFRQPGLSNCVVRNCWIRNTGQTWAPSQSGSGIQFYPGLNFLCEDNLIEYNGTNGVLTYNHGIYTGGTNGIYRNNVLRYNGGYGINIDGHGNPSVDINNQIYNNLIYGNYGGGTAGSPGDQIAVYDDSVSGPSSGWQTNYIYGNTVISPGAYAIICQNGSIRLTNNIIISSNDGIHKWSSFSSDVIYADYNLAPQKLGYSGAHDVIASTANFLNSSAGLYWIRSNSLARNRALSSVCGPLDFFGNSQGSVLDIGAFQYNPALLSDPRTLDPSSGNPDYWSTALLTNAGTASLLVTPNTYAFGPVTVGTSTDQVFTVQNAGSTTFSGTATVPLPFSIVSGGAYTLTPGQTQSLTVRYSPTTVQADVQTLVLSGGGGASAVVSGSGVTMPPNTSAITQTPPDVDGNSAGIQAYAGTAVTYSGSATGGSGALLSWRWLYSLNGGAENLVLSGTGSVAPVQFTYAQNDVGNTYVWKLRVTDGITTVESDLTVGVESPVTSSGGTSFQASAGTITSPFVLTNGAIYQAVSTGATDGGSAVFNFTLTNSGAYVVQALVNAPNDSANSFYVSFDTQPQDPGMIWDILPFTTGFEQRTVSWRGNGTFDADEFVPQVFQLTTGQHQLIVRGREANVFLQNLTLMELPPPPSNLRIVASP